MYFAVNGLKRPDRGISRAEVTYRLMTNAILLLTWQTWRRVMGDWGLVAQTGSIVCRLTPGLEVLIDGASLLIRGSPME